MAWGPRGRLDEGVIKQEADNFFFLFLGAIHGGALASLLAAGVRNRLD